MTPVSEFREAIRFFVGDHEEPFNYQDGALDRGVRTILKTGGLPGYRLSVDQLNVTPAVTDQNKYLLLTAKVAQGLISANPDRQSFRSRPYSESIGSFRELGFDLAAMIYKLECGPMFQGWQSFASFIEGYAGVRHPWMHWIRVKVAGPLGEVVVGADGVSDASASEVEIMRENAMFTYAGPIAAGVYLQGEFSWEKKMELTRAVLNCNVPPSSGSVVLALEIAGAAADTLILPQGQTRVEMDMALRVPAGYGMRWKCLSAPEEVQQTAAEISINMTARRFEG